MLHAAGDRVTADRLAAALAELEGRLAGNMAAYWDRELDGAVTKAELAEFGAGPHNMDYNPTRWHESPRIVMRSSTRASHGTNHLGMCWETRQS